MKKAFFFMLFCLIFARTHIAAQIEISFTYNRQSGSASNQFAVWIEDARGRLVRTLYATRYTANGGWERRPLSIPLWTRQSGLATLSRNEIDAFTGATPRTGTLSYRWDGVDKNGTRVTPGEYRIFLEATLRGENRVIYSAPITLGGDTRVQPVLNTEYFGTSTRERSMIEGVSVLYTN